MRGYIAMLAVREEHRGRGIATKLVRMAIDAMIERDADEVCIPFQDSLPSKTPLKSFFDTQFFTSTDSTRDRSHQYGSYETL